MNWYALQVKRQRERSICSALESKGYNAYLPLIPASGRLSDGRRPLFPGYLFLRFNPSDQFSPGFSAVATDGVIRILGCPNCPIPVSESEIANIKAVVSSGLSFSAWPYLNIGNIVQIKEGPLKGLTGILQSVKSSTRLIVSVDLLQRSLAVEIDLANLSGDFVENDRSSAIAAR